MSSSIAIIAILQWRRIDGTVPVVYNDTGSPIYWLVATINDDITLSGVGSVYTTNVQLQTVIL